MSGRLITLANCALFGSGRMKLKTWKRKSLKLLILRWEPSLLKNGEVYSQKWLLQPCQIMVRVWLKGNLESDCRHF
jgi:hypothetical protein